MMKSAPRIKWSLLITKMLSEVIILFTGLILFFAILQTIKLQYFSMYCDSNKNIVLNLSSEKEKFEISYNQFLKFLVVILSLLSVSIILLILKDSLGLWFADAAPILLVISLIFIFPLLWHLFRLSKIYHHK